jgi:hypothetical protein
LALRLRSQSSAAASGCRWFSSAGSTTSSVGASSTFAACVTSGATVASGPAGVSGATCAGVRGTGRWLVPSSADNAGAMICGVSGMSG